ncbi:CGA synthase-related protein [Streptomyces sp. NBC_00443]|uniref:CGA synthase-related protein n=1 Tax=Streptomyces sp. NBC_00443 TaxID=2975743 RepID=UPI002E1D31B5
MTTRRTSAQTGLRVLTAALPGDPESHTVLRWICAHLTEVELVPGQRTGSGADSPDEPADVAIICDDTVLAERTERSGTAVVFVSSTGTRPVSGWPPTRLRSLHRPGWLPDSGSQGVHQAGTVAPPRAVRARHGQGALIRLAVPGAGQAEACARLLRRAQDALTEGAHCPVSAVQLYGPGSANVAEKLRTLVPGPTVFEDGDPAAERALADVSLLVSSPGLTGVTLAQTARVPLALLPPFDAVQQEAASVLASVGAPLVVPSGDRDDWTYEAGTLRRALDAPEELSVWTDAAQRAAGDDRRGAQRIARRVRQLLLAPM